MRIIRKILSKLLSPLDRYVKRRMEVYCRKLDRRLFFIEDKFNDRAIKQCVPRNFLYFEVHLAEHCNLNCAYCGHFSPLADEEFLDIEEYTRDCRRLSFLFNGQARTINLLGGEPLLHKDIIKFMQVTRECFPHTKGDVRNSAGISIVTNGLLLPKMGDDFWQAVRKYEVGIRITKYPINFDYDAVKLLCDKMGAANVFTNDTDASGNAKTKVMDKFTLDIDGRQSYTSSFLSCDNTGCHTLKHGKLYVCPAAAHAHIIKKHFNLDIELSPDNGIDIYKAKDDYEIMERLTRPIPFCRYCNISGREHGHTYRISKRTLDEWV